MGEKETGVRRQESGGKSEERKKALKVSFVPNALLPPVS
jgi:hypothetical protein